MDQHQGLSINACGVKTDAAGKVISKQCKLAPILMLQEWRPSTDSGQLEESVLASGQKLFFGGMGHRRCAIAVHRDLADQVVTVAAFPNGLTVKLTILDRVYIFVCAICHIPAAFAMAELSQELCLHDQTCHG
eukprot:5808431-Amphidinium_carterae.2